MNFRKAFLSAAIIMAAGAASALPIDINFEGLRTGQGPIGSGNTASLGNGVTVAVTDPFTAAGNTPYTLGVYDSACRLEPEPGFQCTGGNGDLATGTRITFPAIEAKEDTPAEGMILVTPQGSGTTFADRLSKALFTFSFGVLTYVHTHYTTEGWLRAAGWIQLDDSNQGDVRCQTTPLPPSRKSCVPGSV